MKKDTQFTLRIPTDLKKDLQNIAAQEGRSAAQICEAFLRAGSEGYKKEGPKFSAAFSDTKKHPRSWSTSNVWYPILQLGGTVCLAFKR